MAEIVLDKLGKRYPNGFEAVKELSLEIGEAELLVLVGPSGCGKTTALRMIAGLEDITSGDLYIGGKRVNDVLERDRDIAMVFQNYALYPHMTVAQNIAFSLKLARRRSRRSGSASHETARAARPRGAARPASEAAVAAGSASGSRWAARSSASRRCS